MIRDTPADRTGEVRLDKWLWAARFFKSRALATEAVAGGKVHVHDERVKPARAIKPGDQIRIRLGYAEHVVVVRAVSDRRGSAAAAQALYEETDDSKRRREHEAAMRRYGTPILDPEQGRPTKRDRRALERFRRQHDG